MQEEIEANCDENNLISVENVKNIIDRQQIGFIFKEFQSKYLLDEFLKNNFNMVSPIKVEIGTTTTWKKSKNGPVLVDVPDYAIVVPFEENLRSLLMNENYRSYLQFRTENGNSYKTILDGSFYKDSAFFQNNNNALGAILYYDEAVFTNPIGTRAKPHKMGLFYWSLANLDPRVRSTFDAMQLYAIVNYETMKKHGLRKVMEPLVKSINKLQAEGITIVVDNEEINYKVFLIITLLALFFKI